MHTLPPATTLRPGQARVINASEGLTIRVLQGRMWVTRPDDRQDHFLTAGQDMPLTGPMVVVEPDFPLKPGPLGETRYVLLPTPLTRGGGVRATPAAATEGPSGARDGSRGRWLGGVHQAANMGPALLTLVRSLFQRKKASTA